MALVRRCRAGLGAWPRHRVGCSRACLRRRRRSAVRAGPRSRCGRATAARAGSPSSRRTCRRSARPRPARSVTGPGAPTRARSRVRAAKVVSCRAPCSPGATGSWPCWARAAWARSTAPTTSRSASRSRSSSCRAPPSSEEMLARFRSEVRIARRVSHRNVCRVYDIGEAEGRHFLSMEYVDGEDLASLLRRIGRLPPDKAIEVARGVCAGLAAAHEKGVLHRDLKPANVMLDRQGEVVITDFGLAALADQVPRARRAQRHAELHGARAARERRGHDAERHLRARPRAVRDLHRAARVRRRRRSPASGRAETSTKPEQPVVGGARPRSRRRARDPLVPRARTRAAPALGAARWRPRCRAATRWRRRSRPGRRPSPEIVAERRRDDGLASARGASPPRPPSWSGSPPCSRSSIRSSGLDQVGVESPDVLAQKAREILAASVIPSAPYDSAFGFGQEEATHPLLRGAGEAAADWQRAAQRAGRRSSTTGTARARSGCWRSTSTTSC